MIYNPYVTRGKSEVSEIVRIPKEFELIHLDNTFPLNKFTSNLQGVLGECSVSYLSDVLLEENVKLNYDYIEEIKEQIVKEGLSKKTVEIYKNRYGHLF